MKNKKVRKRILGVIFLLLIGAISIGVNYTNHIMLREKNKNDSVINHSKEVFKEENVKEVINTEDKKTNVIDPFNKESVSIVKNYYDDNDEPDAQEKSLIYYENTYMPNTGILYGDDNPFDVLSIMDGKVIKIDKDETLKNSIEIKYSNNLTCIYYTLDNIELKEGDMVIQGQKLGEAGISDIKSDKKYTFLFETYIDSKLVNPKTVLENKSLQ